MSDYFKMNGPYRFGVDFGVITEDGRKASVSYQFGWSRIPTEALIEEAKAELLPVVEDQLGMPVRFMTKQEYWDYICEEKGIGEFALPGGKNWDKPEVKK